MDLLHGCSNVERVTDEILSCFQACLVMANIGGEIIYTNPSVKKVLGFTPAELNGRNLSVFFTPEDSHCLCPNLVYMATKRHPFEGEVMLKRKNGTCFFAFIVSLTCTVRNEEETIMVMCIQDIDKLKQHEIALRQTSSGDLVMVADGIAHKLRNSLIGIGGFVNKLYKSCRTDSVHDKYYECIGENIRKVETLVEEVESFAHLPDPGFVEESIREVIESALEPYYQQMKERKVDLNLNLDQTTFFVDAGLMAKMFSILIENALEAIDGEGSISISVETRENECKIYVRDTGCGISQEEISRIFDPFFSTKVDRVGMSLAVVKRILHLHGGKIEVASRQGWGTTILLSFPLERRRAIRVSLFESAKPS